MFNGFKPEDTRTDQQILDDWADQYDGTLPDKLKKFFKQKAESVDTVSEIIMFTEDLRK